VTFDYIARVFNNRGQLGHFFKITTNARKKNDERKFLNDHKQDIDFISFI
jgi:hypothetical protein